PKVRIKQSRFYRRRFPAKSSFHARRRSALTAPAAFDGYRSDRSLRDALKISCLFQNQGRLVDGDARTHGRADRDLLQVLALGGRRLGLDQVEQQRLEVALERTVVEIGLADGAMDDAGL